MRSIAIGLLGAGNVGTGVLRILEQNRDAIERRLNAEVRVKHVLVRSRARPRESGILPSLLTTDAAPILDDPDVRIIVELIGGVDAARDLVLEAIRRGKHVVTANKALLAVHGREIFDAAARSGLSVYFEGSVAGGIPIIRTIREGLASDRITAITGILNGTSNYILDRMARKGCSYDDALAEARRGGYAEADPTLDVEGVDAAQKLALLTLVGFGRRVDPTRIPTRGITAVGQVDIAFARDLGYQVKSLASVWEVGETLLMRVSPTLVARDHVLADIQGAYNAVMVQSMALGRSLYCGQGAGMMPTGMAVVSDLIEICREIIGFSGRPPVGSVPLVDTVEPGVLDDVEGENYLRIRVLNVPGMLGRVASCLGRHGVSIKRMHQDAPGPGAPTDMVILTESVQEERMVAALAELQAFDDVQSPVRIPIASMGSLS